MSKSISKNKRHRIASKTDGRCFYCGDIGADIDHVIPKSKGGTNDISNLVIACKSCNRSKKDKSLDDFRYSEALKKTKYHGIINSIQAKALIDLGVNLELATHTFWFERVQPMGDD